MINGKKLKYVMEADLPLPYRQVMLRVRVEGTDKDLNSITFGALQEFLEAKLKKMNHSVQRLISSTPKTLLRNRDARGRYVKNIHTAANESNELAKKREWLRLLFNYEALLSKSALRTALWA
jgi:hypothetical protein